MTEKEQEILELYLKDLRKKRIIAVFIIICIIIIGSSYARNFITGDKQEEILVENTIKENITNQVKTNNTIENKSESTNENKEQNQIPNEIIEKVEENNEIIKENKQEENKNVRKQ